MEKRLTIKEWEECDRPREKFAEKGSDGLTNTELLAILIGSGTKKQNAIEVARALLRQADGSLKALWQIPHKELMEENGIGYSKAITLCAVGELVKRTNAERAKEKTKIMNAADAADYMEETLKDLPHEECWVVFLNRGNKVIAKEKVTSGGLSSTVLDAKLIAKSAMSRLASGVILFHNHPGGDPHPSKADIHQTRKLKGALEGCDVKLMDHIIFSPDSYFSFANVGGI